MSARDQHDATAYFSTVADRWDEVYGSPTPLGHHVATRMRLCVEMLGDVRGCRLLDLGCGTGTLLDRVGPALASYDGVDVAESMVSATTDRIRHMRLGSGFGAQTVDVSRLPFHDGAFDVVVALGLLHLVDDPPAVIREAMRVVRPGGRIVISAWRRYSVEAAMVRVTHLIQRRHNRGATARRPRSDAGLLQMVRDAGGVVTEVRHYDRRILPYPLTSIAPRLAARAARLVERRRGLDLFATSTIVLCIRGEAE